MEKTKDFHLINFSRVSSVLFYGFDLTVPFHLFSCSSETLTRHINFLCSIPFELFHILEKNVFTYNCFAISIACFVPVLLVST